MSKFVNPLQVATHECSLMTSSGDRISGALLGVIPVQGARPKIKKEQGAEISQTRKEHGAQKE